MQTVTVTLEPRTVTGKAVKHLRKEGIVPAVIHDHGKESLIMQVEYQTAYKAYQDAGKHAPVEVKADGKTYTTLIKSVTFDPIYNAMTHIVFNAVKANETVEATIPVHPRFAEGNDASPAERSGLIVLTNVESVDVKALPKNLPEMLVYDAEKLVVVGDHATVADLIVPAGVVVETAADKTIASVYEPSALQAANDAVGGDVDEADAAESETTETVADATEDKGSETKDK